MFGFDPTLVTFTIYIFGMLLIGVLAYYYTNNLSDYILGGRRLGSFVTAMSAGASDMSGWLLMGLPGAVYLSGLVEGWIAIGLTLGAYFNWLLVAGRLRVYTELNNNALTLPELLCFGCSCRCKIIPKFIFSRIFHRTLVRSISHHSLHFYRWFFSSKLDRYHSSNPYDFCAALNAYFCVIKHWRYHSIFRGLSAS